MLQEIHQSWHFPQPPEKVWEYLTKAELLETWLGKTDFLPVQNHAFQISSPTGNNATGEVLEIKPKKLLSYSWQKNSALDNKPFRSIVTWTLLPKDDGMELNLEHSGFVAKEDVESHTSGWNECLKLMSDLLGEG